MGCYFVKQQDWAASTLLSDQIGMGQYDREEQGLLLAGRTFLRRLILGCVKNGEVGAMWAFQCAARGSVFPPVRFQAVEQNLRIMMAAILQIQPGRSNQPLSCAFQHCV